MGVLFALMSALVWGSGDFCGGLAARRGRLFPATALAALSGLIVLVVAAWLRREAFPGMAGVAWSLAGGACGMFGIATLYYGLAVGRAGVVAPTASIVGAAVTLAVGVALDGPPSSLQSVGLLIGLAGIWLVSRPASEEDPPGVDAVRQSPVDASTAKNPGFMLGVIAGVFFGAFFVFIAQVEPGLIFTPLVLAKTVALALAWIVLLVRRDPPPGIASNPMALLAGLLDAGGNIFFLLARQFTRMDVAAIVSSMYPASTVMLSALILNEPIGLTRRFGLLLCLAASALIAA